VATLEQERARLKAATAHAQTAHAQLADVATFLGVLAARVEALTDSERGQVVR
jgi:hypothetical protein